MGQETGRNYSLATHACAVRLSATPRAAHAVRAVAKLLVATKRTQAVAAAAAGLETRLSILCIAHPRVIHPHSVHPRVNHPHFSHPRADHPRVVYLRVVHPPLQLLHAAPDHPASTTQHATRPPPARSHPYHPHVPQHPESDALEVWPSGVARGSHVTPPAASVPLALRLLPRVMAVPGRFV